MHDSEKAAVFGMQECVNLNLMSDVRFFMYKSNVFFRKNQNVALR